MFCAPERNPFVFVQPPFNLDVHKLLKGHLDSRQVKFDNTRSLFISSRAQIHLVLGAFQEALGVAITQDVVDLSNLNRESFRYCLCYVITSTFILNLTNFGSVCFCDFEDLLNFNRDYHLEAFNNLTAPGEDPMKSNCFQLLSLHLENPSAPLNLLNSLFSLHPELDYMITLLPRYNCLKSQ